MRKDINEVVDGVPKGDMKFSVGHGVGVGAAWRLPQIVIERPLVLMVHDGSMPIMHHKSARLNPAFLRRLPVIFSIFSKNE